MVVSFIQHVFNTLTYARTDLSAEQTWLRSSKDFNRYIQRLRRLHNCPIHYVRTLENHQDGYCHIHTLLQFPDARIKVENQRYFDRTLYLRWKVAWRHGLSDYQVPRSTSSKSLSYILKYITKSASTKTIWKKIFKEQSAINVINQISKTSDTSNQDVYADHLVPVVTKTISFSTMNVPTHHPSGAKFCSWSRNFNFSLFTNNPTRKPCLKPTLNTQKTLLPAKTL